MNVVLILLLGDMLVDKESLAINDFLHIHSIDGRVRVIEVFEIDVSLVLFTIALHRHDFSKIGKEGGKLFVRVV